MKIPCRWFLKFKGFNGERDYLFHTKVIDLHPDSTMRRKGCRVCVQSKSALQSGLHVKCDIAGTYLFWYSCIPRVLSPNCRRVIILGWCHKSCSLLRCGEHNEHNSLCRDAMQHHSCPSYHHHQQRQPDLLHHTPSRLLCRSQTTVYHRAHTKYGRDLLRTKGSRVIKCPVCILSLSIVATWLQIRCHYFLLHSLPALYLQTANYKKNAQSKGLAGATGPIASFFFGDDNGFGTRELAFGFSACLNRKPADDEPGLPLATQVII